MSAHHILLTKVNKTYHGHTQAGVFDVDLSIEKGSFIAILGESGSGKSTLLKLIYGLLSPDSGEVSFNGQRIWGPEEKLIPGHDEMKMIAQDFNLNTYARVYDNISSMLSNTDLEAKKRKTLDMMELLRIDHLAERRAADLSGGEQQRVAIARALITEPEVLLLDEPFSQVDVVMRKQLRADLKRLSVQLGITMIMVSHDPFDGLSLADQLILIRNGKILQQGHPKEIIEKPKNAYVANLLAEANIIHPAQAKAWLNLNLTDTERLAIYPHEISIAKAGIPGIIQSVRYQHNIDELDVQVGKEMLTLQVLSGQYQIGESVFLNLENYRVVAV